MDEILGAYRRLLDDLASIGVHATLVKGYGPEGVAELRASRYGAFWIKADGSWASRDGVDAGSDAVSLLVFVRGLRAGVVRRHARFGLNRDLIVDMLHAVGSVDASNIIEYEPLADGLHVEYRTVSGRWRPIVLAGDPLTVCLRWADRLEHEGVPVCV